MILIFLVYFFATVHSFARDWSFQGDSLVKRAVTYGDTGNQIAASAICNDDQKRVIEKTMVEAARLAKAGSDGFVIIQDMLTEEKVVYNTLTRGQKDRYKETYFTLFGEITARGQWDIFKERISFIKAVIDRIAPLTKETWPERITIFCDTSYYQDLDPDGKTWTQVNPALKPPAEGKTWKYDYHLRKWANVYVATDCHIADSEVAGFTTRFEGGSNGAIGDPTDRVTLCPDWFDKSRDAGKSISDIDQRADIDTTTRMSDFARKAARLFLHESLHTYAFNQIWRSKIMLNDVDKEKSYSFFNAHRLASSIDTQEMASRNIENVVYWCIAMFFDQWTWATGTAAQI